ncbi:hypothetical protein A5886_001090 [Enterococcus sp. 8G7_MSG3316]|uniref:Uncharacterized protein n=1 Tax=Candidatus Enterococcus testudinis TaxID=1834191 RepID=A0A242A4R1_9ENTE|nr:hypothetical protein A5886_001090 [Enterococcus sp. 8G7_MSG3316]
MVIYAMVLFFACQIWSTKSAFAKKMQQLSFWRITLGMIVVITMVIVLSINLPFAPWLIITVTILCSSLLLTRFTTFYEEMRLNK